MLIYCSHYAGKKSPKKLILMKSVALWLYLVLWLLEPCRPHGSPEEEEKTS